MAAAEPRPGLTWEARRTRRRGPPGQRRGHRWRPPAASSAAGRGARGDEGRSAANQPTAGGGWIGCQPADGDVQRLRGAQCLALSVPRRDGINPRLNWEPQTLALTMRTRFSMLGTSSAATEAARAARGARRAGRAALALKAGATVTLLLRVACMTPDCASGARAPGRRVRVDNLYLAQYNRGGKRREWIFPCVITSNAGGRGIVCYSCIGLVATYAGCQLQAGRSAGLACTQEGCIASQRPARAPRASGKLQGRGRGVTPAAQPPPPGPPARQGQSPAASCCRPVGWVGCSALLCPFLHVGQLLVFHCNHYIPAGCSVRQISACSFGRPNNSRNKRYGGSKHRGWLTH